MMPKLLRKDIDPELEDAAKSSRLNEWERKFVENIASAAPDYDLTPAQRVKWRQIEDKVYAAG